MPEGVGIWHPLTAPSGSTPSGGVARTIEQRGKGRVRLLKPTGRCAVVAPLHHDQHPTLAPLSSHTLFVHTWLAPEQ